MCTITFHRSKEESKNMKCNSSQTWLNPPPPPPPPKLCRAGVPQNTPGGKAVIVIDVSSFEVSDSRDRHSPEKGRELRDYTELPSTLQ